MAEKILIIGSTGLLGKHIVEASVKCGHPTYALVRKPTLSAPDKIPIIENFKALGVHILIGDVTDFESLMEAIQQVDVVISSVASPQVLDQVNIIEAIKKIGIDKRFLPSEFGNDVDRVHAVEPAKTVFCNKARLRRAIEAAKISYTYVSCNCFASYVLPNLNQPGLTSPPRDKLVIFGDGTVKAVFNKEDDIGMYTIKAAVDPRTLNKIVYIRPPANTYSFNELVALWENKIGKSLEKIYVPEEQLLKKIQETEYPANKMLALAHSILVKGDHTNFEIEPSFGVEASQLYPEVNYTTVDDYLNSFV